MNEKEILRPKKGINRPMMQLQYILCWGKRQEILQNSNDCPSDSSAEKLLFNNFFKVDSCFGGSSISKKSSLSINASVCDEVMV